MLFQCCQHILGQSQRFTLAGVQTRDDIVEQTDVKLLAEVEQFARFIHILFYSRAAAAATGGGRWAGGRRVLTYVVVLVPGSYALNFIVVVLVVLVLLVSLVSLTWNLDNSQERDAEQNDSSMMVVVLMLLMMRRNALR